jgi:diguanylate cyclase (GGDEF)-like protein
MWQREPTRQSFDPLARRRAFVATEAMLRSLTTRIANLRLGIGATLSIAFLAVAFLAAAANLISERGIEVIEPPTPSVGRMELAIPPIPVPVERDEPRAPALDPLPAAVDRYERAVQTRSLVQAAATQLELDAAVQAIQSDDLLQSREHRSPSVLRELERMLHSFVSIGSSRVRAADEQRRLTRNYAIHFDAMRDRARASIDHAWRIFGRVVARQAVITLAHQIETLGAQSIDVLREQGDGQPMDVLEAEAAKLAEAEDAIAATLTQNEHGLVNSQGKAWFASMQDDLASLSITRYALMQQRMRGRALEQQAIGIKARLLKATFARKEFDGVRFPETPDEVRPTARIAPPLTVQLNPTSERSSIIAWISVGVLVMLVIISVATVRSVVGPVRRLVNATARLAKGEMDARVGSGGIKELDTLARAFNKMAERLAQAERSKRDYQAQLEAKVEDRTAQLKFLANNDPLTSLPNQRQLFERLNRTLDNAIAGKALVGVYFLDIDNFKNINDGMGHAFGDKVLQAMAQRLRSVAAELGFAARLGGDEFTVVLERAADLEQIRDAGAQLVRAFHEPLSVDNRDLALGISVGASVFPDHGRTAATLLRAADAALFRAKALGRSQLSMYSPELLAAASAKFAVEQGLRRALERGDFELVYQPELNLETREIELVEALLRWRQPNGTLVSPREFLAVAEESGLIMDIGDWVLRRAVETAARWHHGGWRQARVAINVSSRQLIDSHFVERVAALLREYSLPPRCIEIELTETVLQTGTGTIEALRQLRAHGISIALDDFGTGYSSIASLQTLPLTRIKLDRSLIDEIDTSSRSLAIARSIVSLGRSLGLQITAEGIERSTQLDLLREGNMCVQGHLFSHPLPESDLIAALDDVAHRALRVLDGSRVHAPRDGFDADVVAIERHRGKANTTLRLM